MTALKKWLDGVGGEAGKRREIVSMFGELLKDGLSTPEGLQRRVHFMDAFSRLGAVVPAARVAQMSTRSHYDALETDLAYPELFAEAQRDFNSRLEAEVNRRGLYGVDEIVVSGGHVVMVDDPEGALGSDGRRPQKPLTRKVYSDRCLELSLKANMPDRYGDRWRGELAGPHGGPLQVIDPSRLPDDELEVLIRILQRMSVPVALPPRATAPGLPA